MSEVINQNQPSYDDEKMFTDFDRLVRGKIFGGRLAAVIQFVNPKTFERNRERRGHGADEARSAHRRRDADT